VAKSTARRSTLERRVRAIPWGTLAQGVVIVGARWVALSAKSARAWSSSSAPLVGVCRTSACASAESCASSSTGSMCGA
jgi:hypothetical protein